MIRRTIGTVRLIHHGGNPVKEWTVKRSGDDDTSHLVELFNLAVNLCDKEISDGGTLCAFDEKGNKILEARG